MNRNKITKALAGSLLVAASTSAVAKVETFSLNFVTIADLTITQENAISFGQKIIGKNGTSCTIGVAVTTVPADTTAAVAASTDITDGISGAGCIDATAATANTYAGVYTVNGATGQAVNVTVASATGPEFNFSPSGKLVTYGAAATAAVDVFADSSASVTLGATSGDAMLVVGGTVDINADLTANTPYSLNFDITAVY